MASLTELDREIQLQFDKGETLESSRKLQRLYQEREQNPVYQLQKSISNIVVELESKLDTLDNSLVLSDDERQAFLEKAMEQITPYYEEKRAEIEAGIAEGSVRTAEDALLFIRDVQENTSQLLQKFDVDSAQTEEEFLDNMSFATARKDEDLAVKRVDWKNRIESTKLNQVQAGIFGSGVGRKKVGELESTQQLDESIVNNEFGRDAQTLERNKQFSLEQITMARAAAERERINKIGTPEEVSSLVTNAKNTLGLAPEQNIGSTAEVMYNRDERKTPVYNPTALTDLNEQKSSALESRNLELQNNELAVRKQRESANREKIMGELAYQRSRLGKMGV